MPTPIRKTPRTIQVSTRDYKRHPRAGRVEVYDKDRYFTVTGNHLPGSPSSVEKRDLTQFHYKLQSLDPQAQVAKVKAVASTNSTASLDQLMAGDWKGRYTSPSHADAALCAVLARKFNGDYGQIDAMFRRSGLMRRKWDELRGTQTYGQLTIENAIKFVQQRGSGNQVHASNAGPVAEQTAGSEPVNWRKAFKSYDEMEEGDLHPGQIYRSRARSRT